MKFNSVKEYFIRLNSNGYQRMMVPLIFFTLYFGQSGFGLLQPFLSNAILIDVIFYATAVCIFICLTTVQFLFHKKYKKISAHVGLGLKLDLYGDEALKKMKYLSWVAIVPALALFASGDLRLAIVFGVTFLWSFTQWPGPYKVAHNLKLKGDERKMVITKGEAFRI